MRSSNIFFLEFEARAEEKVLDGLKVPIDSGLRINSLNFLKQADGLIIFSGCNQHAGMLDQSSNFPIVYLGCSVEEERSLCVLIFFPCMLSEEEEGLSF